jgi:hypothetical protein
LPAAGPGPSSEISSSVFVRGRRAQGNQRRRRDVLPQRAARCAPRRAARRPGARYWCAFLGSEQAGSERTALARLSGGTLMLARRLSQTSAVSDWAVIGGTGTYAGARGSARLRQTAGTKSAVTITLLGDA